jgi:hypothetical protein
VLPDLKVDVPQLEPSPVLLEQLAQLSQLHAPPAAAGGPSSLRALMAAATVTVVGGVSWLTGTLPGVASPFAKEPPHRPASQHAPLDPSPGAASAGHAAIPSTTPPSRPPGLAKPHHHSHHGQHGHHNGQTKPHQNNGNHTGQTKPHDNYGQGQPDVPGDQSGDQSGDHPVDHPVDHTLDHPLDHPGQSGQDHGQSGPANGQANGQA